MVQIFEGQEGCSILAGALCLLLPEWISKMRLTVGNGALLAAWQLVNRKWLSITQFAMLCPARWEGDTKIIFICNGFGLY